MYCYANFYCYSIFSIVLGQNFREGCKSLGTNKMLERGRPRAPCGRGPVKHVKHNLSDICVIKIRKVMSISQRKETNILA